jgi:hypothetical protein
MTDRLSGGTMVMFCRQMLLIAASHTIDGFDGGREVICAALKANSGHE